MTAVPFQKKKKKAGGNDNLLTFLWTHSSLSSAIQAHALYLRISFYVNK